MQKINREALKEALAKDAQNYPHAQCDSTIRQAAAAFLEITDPEYGPDDFRAMMKELAE